MASVDTRDQITKHERMHHFISKHSMILYDTYDLGYDDRSTLWCCPIFTCNTGAPSKDELESHTMETHGLNPTLYVDHHHGTQCLHSGFYFCPIPFCDKRSKTWCDLMRHTTDIHCLNARRYPCHETGCKYSGNNGFKRKYRLRNHVWRMHINQARHTTAYRTLKSVA